VATSDGHEQIFIDDNGVINQNCFALSNDPLSKSSSLTGKARLPGGSRRQQVGEAATVAHRRSALERAQEQPF
jgi:hypothetical protein